MLKKFGNPFSNPPPSSFSNKIANKLFDSDTRKLIKSKKKRDKKPVVLEALNKQVISATGLIKRIIDLEKAETRLSSKIDTEKRTILTPNESMNDKMAAYNKIIEKTVQIKEDDKKLLINHGRKQGLEQGLEQGQQRQQIQHNKYSNPIHQDKATYHQRRHSWPYGGHKKPKKLSKKSTTKKKSPKVHIGPRGGKYIIKKGQKIYK